MLWVKRLSRFVCTFVAFKLNMSLFSAFKKLTTLRPEEMLPQRDAVVISLGTVSLFILTMQIFKGLYESECNVSKLYSDLWHLNTGI